MQNKMVTELESLLPFLCCPHSQQGLAFADGGIKSNDNKYIYPVIDGIPFLMPEPALNMQNWKSQLAHLNQLYGNATRNLPQDLNNCIFPESKQRISTLAEGKSKYLEHINGLLQPFVQAKPASLDVYEGFALTTASGQNFLSYQSNIYRDWIWGTQEIEEYVGITELLLGEKGNRESVAILGCGAGAYSYQLQKKYGFQNFINIDINPLYLSIASKLQNGESFRLGELPGNPLTMDQVYVEHEFNAPPLSQPMQFVYGDVKRLPLQRNAFDSIVTPWFIDIQPDFLVNFLLKANSCLKIGGELVNFGSLVFHNQAAPYNFLVEEVEKCLELTGFTLLKKFIKEMEYLKSPYEQGHRMEKMFCFAAKKVKQASECEQANGIAQDVNRPPEWLFDFDLPIPADNFFKSFAARHTILGDVAAQVNGKLSIRKIAGFIGRRYKMSDEESLATLKQFFLKLFHEMTYK